MSLRRAPGPQSAKSGRGGGLPGCDACCYFPLRQVRMRFGPGKRLAVAVLLCGTPAASAVQTAEPASGHRRWREQAAYFITEREAEVFASLASDDERDRFIEAFWRLRDPVPGTPQNEFQEELGRRFDYANRELRGNAFSPGWQTDRGRMYIVLGPPRSIETFDNYDNLHPAQLWFYQGDSARNLPRFFYLLFFKREEAAQYRLFVPGADTPGDLLRGPARSFAAHDMEQLRQISPELARAALAMDAAEPVDLTGGVAGLGSLETLARIEASPRRAIRDDHLDAWERYRDRVSAEYSFNFVPSDSVFRVLYGPGVGPEPASYLHYSVELDLEDLALDQSADTGTSFTTLDVTLEVRDAEGRLVLADEKEAFVQLTRSHLARVYGSRFAYQDGVPVVPGDYGVMVILRNRVSFRYTVAEQTVRVSAPPVDRPALSDIVTGFRLEEMSDGPDTFQTFQAGPTRVHPAAGGAFAIGDALYCALQVLSAEPGQVLRFALLRSDEVIASQERTLSGREPPLIAERISLEGVEPDQYTLRVRLADGQGAVLAERRAPLVVSPRASLPRAGVFARRSFDTRRHARLAVVLGDQHWARGEFAEAERLFERAVSEDDPEVPQAKWKLAASHLRGGKPESALRLLLNLQFTHGDRYEVAVGLGLAFGMKDNFPHAVSWLERAASIRPLPASVLNTLGDAYLALGDRQKARETFERSFELDPDQPGIQQRLTALDGSRPSAPEPGR